VRLFSSFTPKPALTLALCAQNWIIPDYPYTSARGENQSEFESECEDIFFLTPKRALTLAFVHFDGKSSDEIIADLKDIAKKH
jgi:hypothetical protein